VLAKAIQLPCKSKPLNVPSIHIFCTLKTRLEEKSEDEKPLPAFDWAKVWILFQVREGIMSRSAALE
jgi:hypothetical protein